MADAAGMSAGHNYRYFESKDAIIIALCERRFAGFGDLLATTEDDRRSIPNGLIEARISQFAWWIDPDRGRC